MQNRERRAALEKGFLRQKVGANPDYEKRTKEKKERSISMN